LTKTDQLRDSADFGDGILNLAAVISQLDLVITVDTLAAHLAGAMGIPAWVLIEYACDWRWLASGNSSPWYPSLRLFRQKRQGDWTTPVEELQQELDKWTQRRTRKLQIA
jgi:ADP-heptose:LPS heptosyltransferase